MAGVPSVIADGPWWGVFIFLVVVVFLRAQGTYWLGRLVRSGGERSRWHDRFSGPGMDRARAYLDRWGPIGIPASFLTIGFQSLVNAAAGFARMNWALYSLVIVPGCIAWAVVYATAGISLWAGAVRLGRTSPWLLAAAIAAVALFIWAAVAWRRRRVKVVAVDAA